jgi:GNAT superfamily N-acetyltransferase
VKTALKTLLAEAKTDAIPQVAVRKAAAEDAPVIARLLVAAHRSYQWAMPPEAYRMFVTGLTDVEALLASAEIFVAEREGVVVGTATYRSRGPSPWPWRWAAVQALAVDPRVHRQGIGEALVDTCVRCAIVDGAGALGIHTAPFRVATIKHYEERGFWRTPLCDVDLTRELGLPSSLPVPLVAHAFPLGR